MKCRSANTKVGVLVAFFVTACLLPGVSPAHGSEDLRDWQIHVSPYVWFAGANGTATVGGVRAPFDFDPHDMIDLTEFSGGLRLDVGWRRVRLFTEFAIMVLDEGITRPTFESYADMEKINVELALGYEVINASLRSNARTPALIIVPFVGGRYAYLDLASPFTPPDAQGDTTLHWFEPFVGGRTKLLLTDKWSLFIHGDVGGFGIANASHLTWTLGTGLEFRPWNVVSFGLGYRVRDLDYKRNEDALDDRFHGPTLSATFHR